MSGNSPLDGRMTEHPMTDATPLASEQITQEDREAAYDLAEAMGGCTAGECLAVTIPKAFARHRIAALSASPAPSGQGVSGKMAEPVAYAPKGHLKRYLKGRNTACWVYGSPTADDNDVLYATPAPSCAPGEVDYRLKLAMALFEARYGMRLMAWSDETRDYWLAQADAALSPQGLDAKEGGEPFRNEDDEIVPREKLFDDFRAWLDPFWQRALDYLTATPSQRLDAATVERCAQVAETVPLEAYATVTGERQRQQHRQDTAAAIRALATEPHQHGEKE